MRVEPPIKQVLKVHRCVPKNGSNKPIESLNSICEGLGCSAKATSKVPVEVGAKASIVLLLCGKCKQRFSYPKRTSSN